MDATNTATASATPTGRTPAEELAHWGSQIAYYTRCIMELGCSGKKTSTTGFATPKGMVRLVMTHTNPKNPIWDGSTLDGRGVGNRCGASEAVAKIIMSELAELISA